MMGMDMHNTVYILYEVSYNNACVVAVIYVAVVAVEVDPIGM